MVIFTDLWYCLHAKLYERVCNRQYKWGIMDDICGTTVICCYLLLISVSEETFLHRLGSGIAIVYSHEFNHWSLVSGASFDRAKDRRTHLFAVWDMVFDRHVLLYEARSLDSNFKKTMPIPACPVFDFVCIYKATGVLLWNSYKYFLSFDRDRIRLFPSSTSDKTRLVLWNVSVSLDCFEYIRTFWMVKPVSMAGHSWIVHRKYIDSFVAIKMVGFKV